MDVWFLLGAPVISIMILTTQVTGTETIPSTFIQGESASIRCTDSDVLSVGKYNATGKKFDAITSCFAIDTECVLANSAVQYTDIYVINKIGNSVSVNIANISRNRDGGMWKCAGVNITIDVKVPVPYVSIIKKNNMIFTDGLNTDVSCKSGVSYPRATITWSFINGGNNLVNGTTTNNSDGSTTSILQYTADKSYDNKRLQCTATNGYGPNKTDSLTLNIRFTPRVHMEQLISPYKVIEGKQLVLNCSVDEANPPVPSNGFTWSKNGIDVKVQSLSIYIVNPVQGSDNGSYTCTGTNSVGPGTSTPVQVDVLYPPIVSTPSTYQVIESTNLTLQCTATANPGNINYTWTGPGNLDYTGSSLIISNIGKDRTGVYTCTATNMMTTTTGPQETGRGTSTTNVTVLYGPTVTISPDDITKIRENTDHRLTCTVQSNPTPTTFTWYLPNGTSIPGDTELVISKKDQGGTYRCQANTTLVPTVGRSITRPNSTAIDITVLYLDPVMLTPVEDIQEGDTINITCSTNSNPVALITWYNDTTIISSNYTNSNTYTIQQTTCLDTGDYTCHATNTEIPNVQYNQSLTLLVKCSPRQDTRVITTAIVSGNITDIVQLVADVISYPSPTFTWYYNNITTGDVEPIYNDDVFNQNDTNISINTYNSTLYINITSNIYYTSYTVNVSNNIGYTELEYQVTGQSKPDVPSNINSSATRHDSICITWTPGFDGLDQQEFIVEHSVDNKTWTSSTPLPESKPDYCIKNLQADTPYYIRVIARNKYGDSQPVYLISSNGSSTIQTLKIEGTTSSPGPGSSYWGLIGGIIGGVVAAMLVVVLVIVLIKRHRKQSGDKENRHTLPLVEVPSRQPDGMIIDEVVNYISADEIKEDETTTYAQVNKENKKPEIKPSPESLYATVNKTKNDETTKPIKPVVKPKKPDAKPKKPDTKPTVLNVKNKQPTNENSSKSKGEAYENVGIFGDINGSNTNEYENHSIKPGPTETVYADLDFDGHQPTTTVRGKDDAVEYSGIDYTKRGPTQPTPPDSSDEDEADNRE